MPLISAAARRGRCRLTLALVASVISLLWTARAVAQSARDVDSASVAPGVRVRAGMSGASRAIVDSGDVRRAAALTFSELMEARAASVNVLMSGGRLIDGGHLLIRGPSTLGTDGAPLLIVDGMRMDEREDDDVGTSSRLDDVAIDDIATVEVLRGPSAAALYGAGASSGVLVVTTKRGQVGGWSAHVRAASEALRDGATYMQRYRRRAVGSTGISSCSLSSQAQGFCTPGEVEQWRPIGDAGLLRTGVGALAALDLAGGTRQRDARLSLTLRRGSGISAGDALSRLSTRLNATQRVGSWLELTGHASYVGDRTEDSKLGAVIAGQSLQSVGATPVDSFARWAGVTLGSAMGGRLDHLTTGFDVAIRPMRRLTLRAALSRDRMDEGAGYVGPPFRLFDSLSAYYNLLGDVSIGGPFERASSWSTNREARVTGELSVPLSVEHDAELLLVAGSEREHRDRFHEQGSGYESGGYAIQSSYRSLSDDAQFALVRLRVLDRFAASVGMHRERDGGVAGNKYYGHPVAEVAVRPAARLLQGDMRLRAAYGESTQRLATYGAFPNFEALYPGYPYGYYPYGNSTEKAREPGPESMQEAEGGVDLDWGSRGRISFTGYHRALSNVIPSSAAIYAFPVPALLSLSSYGVEADARATIVERGSLRWSARAIVATNRNRVTTGDVVLNGVQAGLESGQPVGVSRPRAFTFRDANGDGVAEPYEVAADNSKTPDLLGGSTPTLSVALHSELALGRRLTFGVIVDRRSGAWTQSGGAYSSCAWPEYACREMQDPATPIDVQVSSVVKGFASTTGTTYDATFTRLRELSLRWALPVGRTAASGATSARLMVAGRNLVTWTSWPGTDPEVSSLLRSAVTRNDQSAVPLPRRVMVGLEFDY